MHKGHEALAAHKGHGGVTHSSHGGMVADYRKRFWISLALTLPILVLSPLIQSALRGRQKG